MDEKCVCHINGYRLKDTEARRKATMAGEMANAAMGKAVEADGKIVVAETTANRAKTTADGAVVTARAAYNAATAAVTTAAAAVTTATAAETAAKGAEAAAKTAKSNATAALDTAGNAFPRMGGTMMGDVNMGGNDISNANQIIGNRLGGRLLDFEYIPPNGVNTGEKREIFRVIPDGRGESLSLSVIPWTGTTYDPTAAEPAVLRGVAPGVKDNDAVNMGQVREMMGNGNGSLTTAQINALCNMFKVCAFIKDDVSEEYSAFRSAFGIEGDEVPEEPDTPDEPDEPVPSTPLGVVWSDGYLVSVSNTTQGELTENATWTASDYVDVSGKTEVRIYNDFGKLFTFQGCFYDADKQSPRDAAWYFQKKYVQGSSAYPSPLVLAIPDGAKYVRLSTSIQAGSESTGYVRYDALTYELA